MTIFAGVLSLFKVKQQAWVGWKIVGTEGFWSETPFHSRMLSVTAHELGHFRVAESLWSSYGLFTGDNRESRSYVSESFHGKMILFVILHTHFVNTNTWKDPPVFGT